MARRCFGTKWYGDVPGARSTRDGDTGNEDYSSFAQFFKLDKYAMFSFAMTCGLASDSDKFKIIITLRRAAQNLEIWGPRKISIRAEDASFVSGVVVCCRCHWESRPQEGGGIAQAWATWPEGASAPNGTGMCRGHGVPEMVTPAMRTTAVLLGLLNLTNMPCSVLP